MSTGEERTAFEDKRNMPQQRLKDTFFDYLLLRLQEVSSRVWGGERGCFGSCSLVSGGTDRFSVSNLPKSFLDGDGNILDLSGSDGTGIYFENATGITYYVGLRFCLIPSEVLRNPRNNVIFYDVDVDRIGERDEPDAVVESSGTLEVEVDSIFESGVSNAGRLTTIWLKRPLTIDEAVAIERDVPVVYSGGKNKIVTSGLLGQVSGFASTDPADYQVAAQGVTVRRNTDLSTTDPYAYVGTVTGGGAGNPPAGFSVLGQIDVSDGINPDLQEAYLAGRTITPGAGGGGAVRIASADSGDSMKSLLVLDRKGATEASPISLAIVNERQDGVALASLTPIVHTTTLQEDEAGTTTATTGQVTLTRGGVNLTTANVDEEADLVLLWDFTTAAMNRIYRISSFAAGSVTLVNLDGTAPGTWNGGESGNVSFLRPRVSIAEPSAAGSMDGIAASLVVQGSNEEDSSPPIRIFPRKAIAAIHFFDDSATPRNQGEVTRQGTFLGRTTGTPGTLLNELFRSDRFDNTDMYQVGYVATMGDESAVPFVGLQPQTNASALLAQEDVTLSGAVITFPRTTPVPVDLTSGSHVHKQVNLVLIENSDDASDNKLYSITSFTATTITASELDGSAASFAGTTAKCRILLPRFSVANSLPVSTNGEYIQGTFLSLLDGDKQPAPVTFWPGMGQSDELVRFFSRADVDEICMKWGMVVAGGTYQPKLKIGAVDISSNPVHCGVEVRPHPGGDADELALNVHPGPVRDAYDESYYNRAIGWKNWWGEEVLRLEQGGRIARVSRIFDDFDYGSEPHGSIWTPSTSGGTIYWGVSGDEGGIVRLTATGAATNWAQIQRYTNLYLRHESASPDIYRILNFAGRIRPVPSTTEGDHLNMTADVYLAFLAGTKIGVRYDAGATEDQFEFYAYDGSSENVSGGKGGPGPYEEERGWFKFWIRIDLDNGQIVVSWDREETANSNGVEAVAIPSNTSANWKGHGTIRARVTTKNTYTHGVEVDWVEVWNEVIKSGAADRAS